jgi:hypothetical protein
MNGHRIRILISLTIAIYSLIYVTDKAQAQAPLDTKVIANTLEVPTYEIVTKEIFEGFYDRFEVDYEDSTEGGSSIKFLEPDLGIFSSISMKIESGNKTIRFDWKLENPEEPEAIQLSIQVKFPERTEVIFQNNRAESIWCTETVYLPEGTSVVRWSGLVRENSKTIPRLDNIRILEGNRPSRRICDPFEDTRTSFIPSVLNLLLGKESRVAK